MKKLIIVFLALLLGFIGAELFMRWIVSYPRYGVQYKILGIRGHGLPLVNIFKPYSQYWTVEGGNKVFQRNNLGLNGITVKTGPDNQYIFVLGDSFIEACQVAPEDIASSVLQSKLKKRHPGVEVLNLGYSGHDPYDLYWRSAYFEQKYSPLYVFLILEKPNNLELKRQQLPLTFDPNIYIPTPVKNRFYNIAISIMNHSTLVYLLTNLVKYNHVNDVIQPEEKISPNEYFLGAELKKCLCQFRNKYEKRFALLSIIDNSAFNRELSAFCSEHNIQFQSRRISTPENRNNGIGHLNKMGNRLLGEMMHEMVLESQK